MDISQQVRQIIAEKLGIDIEEINMDSDFSDDLGADSLDKVELIMEFEKYFSLSIPDDSAGNIIDSNVGAVVDYIKKHVN